MEGEEGGGIRLSKRFNNNNNSESNDKSGGGGGGIGIEVDYKTKAGTAWSHSYLNQKPWHPLSYPNQRRKWIAEQTHAQSHRRSQEVAREYAQEQDFFRQTALVSKKEKDKMEMMQAVSFMYVRPPGYNAESAKAAEIADEKRRQELDNPPAPNHSTAPVPLESAPDTNQLGEEKKKPRPKDVFGRPLPTEEEFAVLKNAPRLETGVPARAKPFGIEIRNVKCVRCGNYGHQSGDRECPLKDAIMPNEESRLKRDDPLTAIMAHTDPSEPLKWELKQKPGMSPPRGGFDPDDPNQQIVADDIFDEYGGFLGDGMPELLTNFSASKHKKKRRKSKHKRNLSPNRESSALSEDDGLSLPKESRERRSRKEKKKKRKKSDKLHYSESSSSEDLEFERQYKRCKNKRSYSFKDSDPHKYEQGKSSRHKHSDSCDESDSDRHHKINKSRNNHWYPSDNSDADRHRGDEKSRSKKSSGHSFDFSRSNSHRTSRRHFRHHDHQSDSSWK